MIKLFSHFLLIGGLALLAPSSQANPSLPGGDEVYVEEEIFIDAIDTIDTLGGYMDVSERFIRLAGRPEAAIFFAIEGIVEIYEQRNELALAPPHLQSILDKYPDNKTIRNIVRFRLRDVYNDTGRSDLALRELEAIIAEN